MKLVGGTDLRKRGLVPDALALRMFVNGRVM